MKYVIFICALTLLSVVPALATSAVGDLQFATNYDTLMTQAQNTHKVVVLKFFADW